MPIRCATLALLWAPSDALGVVRNREGDALGGALFWHHFSDRRSTAFEAPLKHHFQAPRRRSYVLFGIILPPFRCGVGATDSHRYGIVLTLILVIGGSDMASFGGISPSAACSKMAPAPLLMPLSKWKEHVIIVLECMDLDYALRVDRPSNLTSVSTAEQRFAMEKWE
ncbi:hypothetical protein AAG906_035600 [Vitis piasezkii]